MTDRHQIQPYPIRMPEQLRKALEKNAKENNRSLHSEIILRLNRSLNTELSDLVASSEPNTDAQRKLIKQIEKMIEAYTQETLDITSKKLL